MCPCASGLGLLGGDGADAAFLAVLALAALTLAPKAASLQDLF